MKISEVYPSPSQHELPANPGDIVEAFRQEIAAAGLATPDQIAPDGELHRFSSSGKRGDRAGWYVLHDDGIANGIYGCWRAGISRNWCARTGNEMTPAERAKMQERVTAAREKRRIAEAANQQECRKRATERWAQSKPADPNHAYLRAKQVQAHGIRQDDNRLLVPVMDSAGGLHGLQTIDPSGAKLFGFGTAKRGHFHQIGEPNTVLLIAEGYATAASIHEATGHPVAVAFDAVNLKPVAEALRLKHPEARIVVAGDNDTSGVGQDKAKQAAGAVSGAVVIPPTPGDWNDIANAAGAQAVRAAFAGIEAAQSVANATPESPLPDMSIVNARRSPPDMPAEAFGPYWHYWLKRQAECRSVPIDYVAGALLASAATLIGNARWVSPWSGWSEPPILWIALVGSPSSGKSPAIDPIRRMVVDIEGDDAAAFTDRLRQWETDAGRAKARKEDWQGDVKTAAKNGLPAPLLPEDAMEPTKPSRLRLWTGDPTTEAIGLVIAQHFKGLLVFRDELAGWLGSFEKYRSGGGGDRAFWIEAYGGRPYVVDRVKHPEPIQIPHLSLGALGGVQPDVLARSVFKGDDDGLSARFLYIWPNSVTPKRPQGSADDPAAIHALRRLRALTPDAGQDDRPSPVYVALEDAAADLFDQWRQAHVLNEPQGSFASWWGKMPGVVLRLSLVLEYLWWSGDQAAAEPTQVTGAAISAAATLVDDYFKLMAENTYGDATLDKDDRNTATLARHILKTRASVVNARDIRRDARLQGMDSADAVYSAIDSLIEAGWLTPSPTRAGVTVGRVKSDFQVNPRIYEARS